MMENSSNRQILKGYFRKGDIPTEGHFVSLIDAMYNMDDDGKMREKGKGLLLYPGTEDGTVASFFMDRSVAEAENGNACWTFRIGKKKELSIVNEKGEPILSITQDKKVLIYDDLIVRNRVSTNLLTTLSGTEEQGLLEIPADGDWHDLSLGVGDTKGCLTGCGICHITAGYRTGTNSYRMAEATASYSEGYSLKLSSPQKHWGIWFSPIRFRWDIRKEGLFLQVKGKKKKRGEAVLHYRIRERWNYAGSTK